jgi:branched-chain amino acid transport system substrate-binding protein
MRTGLARRRSFVAIVALLAAVGMSTLLVGSSVAPQAFGAAGTVRIGAIANLTGPDPNMGQDMAHAVQVGVEEINASGGINGQKLEVIMEDGEYRPEAGVAAAHKLIDVNKVRLLIEEGGSGVLLPIAEYAKTKNVIVVNVGASSPLIRRLKGTVYSVLGLDDVQGKYLAQWIYQKGFRKLVNMNPNNPFGVELGKAVSKEFERLGGKTLTSINYELNQADYRPDLQRISDLHPDVIASGMYGDDSKLLFKQSQQIGLTVPWYCAYVTTVKIDDPAQALGRLYGMELGFNLPSAQKLRDTLVKRFGQPPTTPYGIYAYDGLWLSALAIRQAGTDPNKLRTVLPKVAPTYVGATGKIILDADGQRENAPLEKLTMDKDGKFVPTN